jgi:outer membrane immunogenic protein
MPIADVCSHLEILWGKSMKKVCLQLAAWALAAGTAVAADLPSQKAPPVLPPAPPPPMWTGFYVGVNAGGTFGSNANLALTQFDGVVVPGVPGFAFASGGQAWVGGPNRSGFIGGGQAGYNYQFYQNFLIGLEADIQGVASSGGNTNLVGVLPLAPGFSVTGVTQLRGSLDYLGTVRGRLGWLFTPTLLLYGTGGFAYGGVTLNSNNIQVLNPVGLVGGGATAFSNTMTGWTAGGGVEWMFWPNWSAKVEYLYYDLGTAQTNNAAAVALTPVPAWTFASTIPVVSAHIRGNIVRAGVNYHFNWGSAPVLAKY